MNKEPVLPKLNPDYRKNTGGAWRPKRPRRRQIYKGVIDPSKQKKG